MPQLKTWSCRALPAAALAAMFATGCSSEKEIELSQLPAPAQETINKEIAGGSVEEVIGRREDGVWVYEVDAETGSGRGVEFYVAEDGRFLGYEKQYEDDKDRWIHQKHLPSVVATAITREAGDAPIRTIEIKRKSGEDIYEVEVLKDSQIIDYRFALDGSLVREKPEWKVAQETFNLSGENVTTAQNWKSTTLGTAETAGNWESRDGALVHTPAQSAAETSDKLVSSLLIKENLVFSNGSLSAKMRVGANGKAGLVWRYQDEKNYHLAMIDAPESRLRIYLVKEGNFTEIASRKKVAVDPQGWITLKVEQEEEQTLAEVGEHRLEATDRTAAAPGAIGLWSDVGSEVAFEEISIERFEAP